MISRVSPGLRGVSVGQVLTELQQGDERQPPRRQPGLAKLGEQVGEVRVGEDGAQLVAQLEERVALAEDGPGDTGSFLRHRLDRAGLERHGGPPQQGEPAKEYPPSSAPTTSPTVSDHFVAI